MAAITSSDVTISVEDRRIVGKQKRNRVKITFGNGTLTYSSGGVPMPSNLSFGLGRNLDYLILFEDDSSQGTIYKYDKTNSKIRIYEQGIRTGSTSATDSTSGALAEGGVDGVTETALRTMGTAVDTTYQLGSLKELTASSKPAATTIYAEAIGW